MIANNLLNAIDYISQYITIEFICFMVCLNLKNQMDFVLLIVT